VSTPRVTVLPPEQGATGPGRSQRSAQRDMVLELDGTGRVRMAPPSSFGSPPVGTPPFAPPVGPFPAPGSSTGSGALDLVREHPLLALAVAGGLGLLARELVRALASSPAASPATTSEQASAPQPPTAPSTPEAPTT
jgi:hypothetical protein